MPRKLPSRPSSRALAESLAAQRPEGDVMITASAWRPIAEAGEGEKSGRNLLLRGRVDVDEDFGRRGASRVPNDPEVVVTVGRYVRSGGWTVWVDGEITGDGETQTRTQTRTRWSREGWSPDWLEVTHFMDIPL